MNIKNLFKSNKLSVIGAAVVFYTLTFSLAGVLAPSTANAVDNPSSTYQVTQAG